jgi:hypothetical protein
MASAASRVAGVSVAATDTGDAGGEALPAAPPSRRELSGPVELDRTSALFAVPLPPEFGE